MGPKLRIFDNEDKTFDRYRVVVWVGEVAAVYTIGPTGNAPNGVCMCAYTYEKSIPYANELAWVEPDGDRELEHWEWAALPAPVLTAIIGILADTVYELSLTFA